ncbi:MAG TPA: CocE/NonD family hydrolase [Pseudonocardiaceae bacterium]|nr:CocE/NonD family hydrolase [Pseudonocardiaceae bacterium]
MRTYDIDVSPNIRIPVDGDGTTLAGDLYRPRTNGRVPGVVTLHYGRRTLGVRCFQRFARAGYATLVVDCRGTGESDGLPRDPLDPREGEDGAAVIAWLADRPWCTGRIGMWGFSGGAALTLLTASHRPPALHAIVPMMGFKSWERDLVHPNGVRGGIGFFMLPAIEKMLNDLLPPIQGADLDLRRKYWQEKVEAMDEWVADAWRHPPGDDAWHSRDVDVTRITAATFCVAGWLDMCRDTMLDTYRKITATKKLVVGPWLHDLPENAALEPVDSLSLACDWWDRWLREPCGREPDESAAVYVSGSDRWTRGDTWPPAPSRVVTFGATTDLALVPPGGGQATGSVMALTDPTVGLLSGLWTMPISDLGYPLDQHDDDQRSLNFTTAPLAEPLTITGQGVVTIALDPRNTARRCVAKLTEVDERGRSIVFAHGLVPVAAEDDTVRLALTPSCHTVRQGHRLRLVLSDSDFPRLWPPDARELLALRVSPDSTTLTLPVVDPERLPIADRPAPAPARDRGVVKFTDRPRWRISRDHNRGEVALELAADQKRLYTSDGAPIRERNFAATATAADDDPTDAGATMGASFHIDEPRGVQTVVRASITIDASGGVATGDVVVDGRTVVSREWRTP